MKNGIDNSYFIVLKDEYEWIDRFHKQHGQLPTSNTVALEFDDFQPLTSLEPISYLVNVLKEQKAYMEYRPLLTENAGLVSDGKTIEAMMKMKTDLDGMLKNFTGKTSRYDWVKNADDRYTEYMKRHGHTGLWGLPTGIRTLDDLTGGWRNDDLVLLAARTNEGKSMVGGYFAYHAWRALQIANVNAPVIYITTEMPELEVSFRLDTLRAHFSNRALNDGKLPDHELYLEYLNELKKKDTSFLILSQEANGGKPFTPLDIRAVIESERPGFIVIDQLYDLSDGTSESDIRKRIVRVTNGVRDTNLYTQTPMMLIAQAGRNAAKEAKKDPNATPELFDIQESDNPAQKATRVLTLRLLTDTFKMSLKKNRGGKKDQDIFMKANLDTGVWEENFPETLVF
jgi:replicative DNA helicase